MARIIEKPKSEKSKQLIGKNSEVFPKGNDTIELKIKLNGNSLKVILDTGSPIFIVPANMREWIQPNELKKPTQNRQFVDFNDNEVEVTGTFDLETELNDKKLKLTWWEVKADTRPILGMDNFAKLDLRIFQGKEEKIGLMREQTVIECFKRKLAERFDKLFSRQGTIRNFKYGVKFKDDFERFQQKERKIPLHIQPAVKNEINKLINSGHLTNSPKWEKIYYNMCESSSYRKKE